VFPFVVFFFVNDAFKRTRRRSQRLSYFRTGNLTTDRSLFDRRFGIFCQLRGVKHNTTTVVTVTGHVGKHARSIPFTSSKRFLFKFAHVETIFARNATPLLRAYVRILFILAHNVSSTTTTILGSEIENHDRKRVVATRRNRKYQYRRFAERR